MLTQTLLVHFNTYRCLHLQLRLEVLSRIFVLKSEIFVMKLTGFLLNF